MRINLCSGRVGLVLLSGVAIIVVAGQLCARTPPVELMEVSAASGSPAIAECACPDCGCALNGNGCGHGGRCARCCRGHFVCCPTVEKVTEEKSCWKVTCEKVCVPAIRLPWEPGGSKLTLFSWLNKHCTKCQCGSGATCGDQCDRCAGAAATNCCAPKCGRVRCVSVLESESYDIKTCRCKWEIQHVADCCDANCSVPAEAPHSEVGTSTDGELPAPE